MKTRNERRDQGPQLPDADGGGSGSIWLPLFEMFNTLAALFVLAVPVLALMPSDRNNPAQNQDIKGLYEEILETSDTEDFMEETDSDHPVGLDLLPTHELIALGDKAGDQEEMVILIPSGFTGNIRIVSKIQYNHHTNERY